MKYLKFLLLFISQVTLIFAHLYKHNAFIRASFAVQKLEKHKAKLLQQIGELENKLYKKRSTTAIQKHAEQELQMKPIPLKSIIKVSSEKS